LNAIINYLDKYTTQIFVLQLGILFILSAILIWVYLYNKKKYHNLKHQIPASVVKNYLDSIIQNSTALKSSLFRGGGLDVDPSSIPSVMPLDQLQAGAQVGVSVDLGSGGDEALRAEVARLQSQLAVKDNAVRDLENKNTELEGIVKAKQERIEELEALLAKAQAEGGGDSAAAADPELQNKLDEVTAERDRLKEDLSQYDIIEDDLADLKRLKQENEQLKSALEGGDLPAPTAAAEVVVEEVTPEPVAEKAPEPEAVAVEEPAAEETPAVEAAASDDKSPEDLLSEFEKMLG
jgi:hypothetical protein